MMLWDGSRPLAADADTDALGAALEHNLAARARFFAAGQGCQEIETPDLLRVIDPHIYRVSLARLAPEKAQTAIDAILDDARRRYITWVVGPATRPANLPDLLKQKGFYVAMDEPGMALPLAEMAMPPPVQHLDIRRVDLRDREGVSGFNRIAEMSFRRPIALAARVHRLAGDAGVSDAYLDAMRFYIGYLGSSPHASASVMIGGGVVGVYTVGTLPEARRRGIASCMTAHALAEAHEEGLQIGVLHASVEGQGVYKRLGFRQMCRIAWLNAVGRSRRSRWRFLG